MCKQCEEKPVYEFTNQRKLCAKCFVKWFKKKVLYTIRKFGMIKNGDVVGYFSGKDFRDVVLEDVLKMYAEKGNIELIKLPARSRSQIDKPNNKIFLVNNKKFSKIAISQTTDLTANEIVGSLINGEISAHPSIQKRGGFVIICPLYLFLDKEVLLYAMLRKLKFEKQGKLPVRSRSEIDINDNKKSRAGLQIKSSKNNRAGFERGKLQKFINELEKKHPEVKQAVVKGMMRIKS